MGQFGSFGQCLRISCLSWLLCSRHHCRNHLHCSRFLGLWRHYRRLRATYRPRLRSQGNYCLINFSFISCSTDSLQVGQNSKTLFSASPETLAHFLHVDECLLRQLQPQGWCTDWQDRCRPHSSRPYQYVNFCTGFDGIFFLKIPPHAPSTVPIYLNHTAIHTVSLCRK